MEKTALKIKLLGDPVLRKRSKRVLEITQRHRELLSQMAQLMYEKSGVGLAAVQAGVNEALIVVDIGTGLYKLINPRIVSKKGSQVKEEGCLSIPGICIKVKRANKIVIKAEDEDSNPLNIEAEGLLACVFQHEIDHLKGKLIVDYASFFKKIRIKKKIEQMQQEAKSCQLQL